MNASPFALRGLRQAAFCLLLLPLLVSCEAIWGGLSRSNRQNCAVNGGNCNSSIEYCSPELERCVPLGPPCIPDMQNSICASTGPDRICDEILKRCVTNVVLEQIEPAVGSTQGGIPVTLTGLYFRAGIKVFFDQTPAVVTEIASQNKLIVTLPDSQGRIGPSIVRVVQADGGQTERSDLFRYHLDAINFTPQAASAAVVFADEIDLADLDADSNVDLITQYSASLDTSFGDGNGHFAPGLAMSPSYTPATADLLSQDINNDGSIDLIFAAKNPTDSTNSLIYVLTNDGRGGLNTKQTLSITNKGIVTHTAIGDFDGDGRDDLLVAHVSTSSVTSLYVFAGMSGGPFSTAATVVSYASGASVQQVTQLRANDLNKDGQDDIIVSGRITTPTSLPLIGVMHSLQSRTIGVSLGEKFYDLANFPNAILLKDINNDQLPDLVAILDIGQTSTVAVATGAGGGSFNPVIQYQIGMPIKFARLGYGEFDGDGYLDILIWDTRNNRVRILIGSPNGSLRYQGFEYLLPATPTTLRVRDLNGDDLADVIAAFGNASPAQVYINTPPN